MDNMQQDQFATEKQCYIDFWGFICFCYLPELMYIGEHLHSDNIGRRFDRKQLSLTIALFSMHWLFKYHQKELTFAASSRGTMSIKKSHMSVLEIAVAISDRCNVRRLFSSACTLFTYQSIRSSLSYPFPYHARFVNSVMKISHPLANKIGA